MDDTRTLWGELEARALRTGPRLASFFGECPSCYLPASDAANIGGVTWSYCVSCLTRWPALDPLARLDPASDGFAALFVEALSMCRDLDSLPDGISPPATIHEETNMRETTTTVEAVDPWHGVAQPKGGGDDFASAPMHWHSLPEAMRAELGAAILRAIGDRPAPTLRDAGSIAHCAWSHVRANPRIERALSDATFPAQQMLVSAVRKLLGAGDVLAHLRQRRAELDRQIEALEKMRGERVAP
jgi:hypothetical protein